MIRYLILLLLFFLLMGCASTTLEPIVVERERNLTPTTNSDTLIEVQRPGGTVTPALPIREVTGTIAPYPVAIARQQATATPAFMGPTEVPWPYAVPPTHTRVWPTVIPFPTPFRGQLPTEVVYKVADRLWLMHQNVTQSLLKDEIVDFAYMPETGALAYVLKPTDGGQSVYLQQSLDSRPEVIYTLSDPLQYELWGEQRVTSVAFSEDGTALAIMLTDRLFLYDRQTSQTNLVFTNPLEPNSNDEFDVVHYRSYHADFFALDDQYLAATISYWEGSEPMVVDLQTGEIVLQGQMCYVSCRHRFAGQVADTWLVEHRWEAGTDAIQAAVNQVSLVLPEATNTAVYTLGLDPLLHAEVAVYDDKVYIVYFADPTQQERMPYRQLLRWDPLTGEETIILEGNFPTRYGELRIIPDDEGSPHFFLQGYYDRTPLHYFDLEGKGLALLVE